MNKIFCFWIVLFSVNFTIYTQENDIDRGIIISGLETNLNWEETIEKKFLNNETEFEIYYSGAWYRGEGIFWIVIDGNRVNILEVYIRYGPMIKWHGPYIAEIFIPTGSPNRHSYFYDFRNNVLSPPFNFPIYYDISKDYIILLEHEGLILYDFKNNKIIENYNFDENIPVLDLLIFGEYKLIVEDTKLFFNFKIMAIDYNIEKEYIFDYNK